MPWKICFTLPKPLKGVSTNLRVCIDIPLLVNQFINPKWITGLDAKSIEDLPILATIDELAAGLSNASLRRTLQTAVQGGVKQPELKDVKIHFGKRA